MFWFTSQEQYSIKTLEFYETNSYFYSMIYEKNLFGSYFILKVGIFFVNLLADRKAVDSAPKYYLLTWATNQGSTFSPCIRYKWMNSIDWSTKPSLTRQGLIWENSSFHLFHHGKNWNVQPRATFILPVVNLCVNWGK